MDVHEALVGRRTIYKFEPEPVPLSSVERAINAARFAPNHKLTNPWRFYVLGPETLRRVAKRSGEIAVAAAADLPEERLAHVRRVAYDKLASLPLCIVVAAKQSPVDRFREREDYAAACCALHNIQLSLWADGIGCQWGTGPVTRDEETAKIVGVEAGFEVIGFVKAGYPQEVPTTRRSEVREVCHWRA